jgi:ubiquinone/menaquinone biosynthesis C-methylase UbiE
VTREKGDRAKRAIAGTYSFLAGRVYDRLVVHGGFRLFGGNLHQLVFEQGREAVQAASGAPILDMPVGTAYFTARVAEAHRGLVAGVDIAEGMVRESKKVAEQRGLSNLVTVCADAHHLPFPDGAFGAVLCTNGLQVIPGLRPTISELVRVLAPGGTIFVSVLLAPFGRLLPDHQRGNLPTLLRPATDIATELAAAGIPFVNMRKERLAHLLWGPKPQPGEGPRL